jgi:hypothetical protein
MTYVFFSRDKEHYALNAILPVMIPRSARGPASRREPHGLVAVDLAKK